MKTVLLMALGTLALSAPAIAAPEPDATRNPAQPCNLPTLDLHGPTDAGTPPETMDMTGSDVFIRNVSHATLTPVLPQGKPRGAVIIAPGGAFSGLAIDKEGCQIARWFAGHGVAAFVLKYRLLATPADEQTFLAQLGRMLKGEKVSFSPPEDTPPAALEDGMAALRLVRQKAAIWHIDPARIGFMGFSAGGFLTRSVVEHAGAEMPAFAAPIYPNEAAMAVPANAPSMFVAVAADDFLLARVTGFPLIESYREAGRPIEFHLFASGGHGFGPGVPGTPTAHWLDQMLLWLTTQHLIEDAR